MEAVLRLGGTIPETMEEFIMSVMKGQRVGRQVLTKKVGMGSREQEEGLAFETNLVTSAASTGEKEEREHWGGGRGAKCVCNMKGGGGVGTRSC